ncbi:serine hydrolase domain-containing protein [Microbacterium kyungheense]|uniref:D-alanyl-D-alanine carboxypeptidase n=1 Tax=Microbacterium kyungheense TaxID=1263636 RepID=A0A543EAM2_9MICO|nr:serine hydrolase domain-containing protein [Microbacterium kyungheense]TQM18631.1 D-alanyl-D-alanine carboxypeptidase [Microbacterium kyungheense]
MTLATPNQTAAQAQDRPELQQILDDIVASGITGITLRVRDERGDWTGAAGRAELGSDALPPIDGHVRVGSNTKTFTAALALRLVEEGRLDLDASAAGYLRGFDLDPRITVRMLLQHTSGVFNFTGEFYPDGTVVAGIPSTISGKEWVDSRFTRYAPEELVRLALSKPGRFEPGTDWSYSNTNYVIVRLIVEKVTGRPIAEEMDRAIFTPLGLRDTAQPTYETAIAEPHPHAYYRYDDDGVERTVDVSEHNPSWISSGGDMISTSQDLQTFLTSLVTGRLLPAQLLTEMRTTTPTPIPGMEYGLGVFVQDLGEHGTVITHNGGAAGYAALVYCTPDGRRSMTATLNYIDDAALTLAVPFQQGSQRLVDAVFRTAPAVTA